MYLNKDSLVLLNGTGVVVRVTCTIGGVKRTGVIDTNVLSDTNSCLIWLNPVKTSAEDSEDTSKSNPTSSPVKSGVYLGFSEFNIAEIKVDPKKHKEDLIRVLKILYDDLVVFA